VRFVGVEVTVFAASTPGCDSFLNFAHRACWASAIFCREAADMILIGWFAFRDVDEPFRDSIAEIV
jgi:hypothetical protein